MSSQVLVKSCLDQSPLLICDCGSVFEHFGDPFGVEVRGQLGAYLHVQARHVSEGSAQSFALGTACHWVWLRDPAQLKEGVQRNRGNPLEYHGAVAFLRLM